MATKRVARFEQIEKERNNATSSKTQPSGDNPSLNSSSSELPNHEGYSEQSTSPTKTLEDSPTKTLEVVDAVAEHPV